MQDVVASCMVIRHKHTSITYKHVRYHGFHLKIYWMQKDKPGSFQLASICFLTAVQRLKLDKAPVSAIRI